VEYLSHEHSKVLQHEMSQAFSKLDSSPKPIFNDQISIIAREALEPLDLRTPFCKNEAFFEESEFRLVHLPTAASFSSVNTDIGKEHMQL
jgi:hypothetical protein